MNEKIWDLYRNSERGKHAISVFSIKEGDLLSDIVEPIYDFCRNFFGDEEEKNSFINTFFGVYENLLVSGILPDENETNHDFYERFMDSFELAIVDENEDGELFKVEKENPIFAQKDYKNLCSIVSEISLALYCDYPQGFLPILFPERFDKLISVLDVLRIPIPEMPAKSDKRGRLLLYNEINKNIINFAEQNNLSPQETCACIYDFAFMLIEENNISKELPEPTNVWLTGGSKEDYKAFLENPNDGAESVWTCNENTKRGDIIIMYVLSPYSCIQSIWRAEIDGVYTPFNYYNSRTKATKGILIPHITINELKNDSYFSQLPITRKNFQGVNGVRFTTNDYKELQRILKNKGFDISVLPQIYKPDIKFEENIKNEKDVEENLLIPLLEKLGFTDKEWTRQLSQKAGRKEKAIPDFVFFPKGEMHFQNAPLVIEAKFDMSSNIEKTKCYNQALSYARMMRASLFGICDKDRLIIYKEKDGYFNRFNPEFEKHWQNINDEETFRKLKLLIGKDVLTK